MRPIVVETRLTTDAGRRCNTLFRAVLRKAAKDALAPVHPDDLARLERTIAHALGNPGASSYVELRLRHADGSWRHVESACTNLLDDPAVGGVVFNSRDVTERKKLEESLSW